MTSGVSMPVGDVGFEGRLVPAEEPEDRQTGGLAQDVEQGHVVGRDDTGVRMGHRAHLGHEALDGQGIPADEHLADAPGHAQVGVLGLPGDGREGTGLAESDQAVVGVDLYEDVVGGVQGPEGDAER